MSHSTNLQLNWYCSMGASLDRLAGVLTARHYHRRRRYCDLSDLGLFDGDFRIGSCCAWCCKGKVLLQEVPIRYCVETDRRKARVATRPNYYQTKRTGIYMEMMFMESIKRRVY